MDRYYDSVYTAAPAILSIQDQAYLQDVPQLKLTSAERAIELPSRVNNAETQFMTPIFYQSGNECGQASTICYTLSYELLRRRHQNYMWGYDYQYPSRFAWNFCNKGANGGVSFLESWEVIRTAGTPTVNEWGGWYNYGEITRWISGYDLYHSAMKNRISEVYAIHIDNEEGLLVLKHWLNDHLCGEHPGGLANFYCTYLGNGYLSRLPAGTPEAGKYVLTEFTTTVNHAKTIVGYDDSICWDYNGDGHYTNDIDINGDGVVNIKDWEVGAVIFCNTFGTDFANNGYCYLPYCKLASLPNEGGIWNSTVYVVQVKDEVYPQITYKATLRHSSRNKIKVSAGIANNTSATQPEHTLDFYVFNYQGGNYPMKGTEEDSADYLEFGLDVSPLLNYMTPNAPCKFFFNVTEQDPNNSNSGEIVNFSLMDYTSGSEVEQPCPSEHVPIANNTTTTLTLVRTINFSKPIIQDTVIPTFQAYEPLYHQLQATGGQAPYRWEISRDYKEELLSEGAPTMEGNTVQLSNTSNGYAVIPLNFDFPFHGDYYQQIVVYANGYLSFHHRPANWPFLQDENLQNSSNRMICPFKANLNPCQIKKIETSDEITLQFNAKINGQASSQIRFAVTLHKSGQIDFYYGDMSYTGSDYESGLHYGDGRTHQTTSLSGLTANNLSNRSLRLTPQTLPEGITLSSSGLLSGTSTHAFNDHVCALTCYDNNDVKTTQNVHFNCTYTALLLLSETLVNGSSDPIIFTGDTILFTLKVKNLDTLTYHNGRIHIENNDFFVNILDSSEYFGSIAPGNEYTLNQCMKCTVESNTPSNRSTTFAITIDNDLSPITYNRSYLIHSAKIDVTGYHILDYGSNVNNFLDPIELDSVIFTLFNPNEYALQNVDLKLRIDQPGISTPINEIHYDKIQELSDFSFPTLLYIGPEFVSGTTFDAYLDVYMNGHFLYTKTVTIRGGFDCLDFADGTLPNIFYGTNSQPIWHIAYDDAHSGSFSMQSGIIGADDTTSVSLQTSAAVAQTISFAYKVSSERNYDWFVFYIDGVQMDRWSGTIGWSTVSYPLAPGEHTLTWQYHKDYSNNTGSDCVWVDDICIPNITQMDCDLQVFPETLQVNIGQYGNATANANLTYHNLSECLLIYRNKIYDEDGNLIDWVISSPENSFLEIGDSITTTLTFHPFECGTEDQHLMLHVVTSEDSVLVPILLHYVDNTGIASLPSEYTVTVTPNPTSGLCTIEDAQHTILKVEIFDIYGKFLFQQPVHSNASILDLSTLPSGLYLLRVYRDDLISTHKIIKK
ncbi:MAG: T9SS type A sorting domain-containing protein [Bacteroidales bacterium]|nr:T9SS type A sorting domain-containing protein [Bacteroidales bacterium]